MDRILLSGESISNKDWIESVQKSFADLFPQVRVLSYDHWENSQNAIDFEKEYSKLSQLIQDLGEYAIFAKSIGTVLVARGIYEKILKPQKCVFVGPAWLVGERTFPEFKTWIEGFAIPTLFITKTADPVAPAAKLLDLLTRYHIQKSQFVELPGDNHKYEDLEKLKVLTQEFLNK